MKKQLNHQHIIDFLFVLSLFCVFAVSSVLLILFGADIYNKTVQQMECNYSSRTSIAYITEKIRLTSAIKTTAVIAKESQPRTLKTFRISVLCVCESCLSLFP